MDKKSVEKLCSVLGDVIKIVVPIIITSILNDSDSRKELKQE